ncbi:MAG: hypothetical protein COB02_06270 [Candidatus Cloacimonadota bacterium]|nr:MAG: hypothetical protein COB02_06270 [Candidatus Cloacimonadota bacterium]
MKSIEVAKLLNLGHEEFSQIEESIAMVFQLKQDENGNFIYTNDHIKALKDVFDNSEMDFDFLKSPNANAKKVEASPVVPKQIPIKRKESKVVKSMDFMQDPTFEKLSKPEKEVKIPLFRKVSKFGEELDSPKSEEDEDVSLLWQKLEEQKTYFNSKFEDFKGQELSVIREENYSLKKKNLQMQKELETLQNIIKSQNDDKQYLIGKLDEKYSIKGLFGWKKDPYLGA